MPNLRRVYLIAVYAFGLLNSAAVAATPESTAISGSVELARLVDTAAAKLGFRVTYDAELGKTAKVTLRQSAAIDNASLWTLTNYLLAEQGWTTIVTPGVDSMPSDGPLIVVVKFAEAQQRAPVVDLASEMWITRASSPDKANGRVLLGKPRRDPHQGGEDPERASFLAPGYQRVLVRLKRASAKDVVPAVQLVMSKPAGTVSEFGKGDMLLIGDLTPHLERTLALVAELDGDAGAAVVEEATARNVEAGRLIALAKSLAEKQKAAGVHELKGELIAGGGDRVLIVAPRGSVAGWRALVEQADQVEPPVRRTYAVSSFGLREVASLIEQSIRPVGGGRGGVGADGDGWRLVTDDLTGSLIITASPADHEEIELLLARLNDLPAEARRPVRSYKVRNRGVKEMQGVLMDLLRAGVFDAAAMSADPAGFRDGQSPSQSPIGSAAEPGVGPQSSSRRSSPGGVPLQLPEGGSGGLVRPGLGRSDGASADGADESTRVGLNGRDLSRSNVVSGTSRDGGGSGGPSLTLTADEPTNTLIAVGDPRVLAQIEQLLPTLDVRQAQVMLDAFVVSLTDSQSVDFGVELERLRVSGDTLIRLSSLFGIAGGAAGNRTVPDRTGFTGAVLDPGEFSIVVRALEGINKGRSLSNPKVLVGNNQQASFNSVLQQPFATQNASTTVSTTSFGGTQDAGTTISVKPQVAQGDHIVLDYSVSLSSFVGAAPNPNLPPPRQQNSVQSVVTIPDGFTAVVGGLEAVSQGDSRTQVPIVGSIPIVGELFKSTTISQSRNRFFVFLRASVLRNENLDDLRFISEPDLKAADVDDGMPDLAPRIIR